MRYITGQQDVINKLRLRQSRTLRRMAVGVEKACVDVANHAKAGHEGDMAHANERYQNRTSTLTRSITPEVIYVGFDEVVGVVFANTEYAEYIENIYPYLFPALVANREQFKRRLQEAAQ